MITSSLMDASEIEPRLLIGGAPRDRLSLSLIGVSDVFLCARECQPKLSGYLIPVYRGRLDDAEMSDRQADEAMRLGRLVANKMTDGRVLVTCHRGLNRAPLVAAIALELALGISANQAIEMISRAREGVFSNFSFVEWLTRSAIRTRHRAE